MIIKFSTKQEKDKRENFKYFNKKKEKKIHFPFFFSEYEIDM